MKKVYVVVVLYHPANEPQNHTVSCEIFTDQDEAEKYVVEKKNEFPLKWGGEFNSVTMLEKEIE